MRGQASPLLWTTALPPQGEDKPSPLRTDDDVSNNPTLESFSPAPRRVERAVRTSVLGVVVPWLLCSPPLTTSCQAFGLADRCNALFGQYICSAVGRDVLLFGDRKHAFYCVV